MALEEYYEPSDPFDHVCYTDQRWLMKNGRSISIYDMDDNHLINTVNLLRKHGAVIPEAMSYEIMNRRLKISREVSDED